MLTTAHHKGGEGHVLDIVRSLTIMAVSATVMYGLGRLATRPQTDREGWNHLNPSALHWVSLIGSSTLTSCTGYIALAWKDATRNCECGTSQDQWPYLLLVFGAFGVFTVLTAFTFYRLITRNVRWNDDTIIFNGTNGEEIRHFGEIVHQRKTRFGSYALRFIGDSTVTIDPYAQGAAALLTQVVQSFHLGWVTYPTHVDEVPTTIVVRHSLGKVAPLPRFPYACVIHLGMSSTATEGAFSAEHKTQLDEIGDALLEVVDNAGIGVSVGRVLEGQACDYYFYLREPVEEAVFQGVLKGWPTFSARIRVKKDTGWRLYKDLLFPTPGELVAGETQERIDQLLERGDNVTIPREIVHYLEFDNEDDLKPFVAVVQKMGFKISEKVHRQGDLVGLDISKMDAPAKMTEVSLALHHVAEQHHGTYAAWACNIHSGPC
jgi:regulator of RNase E activity RraB